MTAGRAGRRGREASAPGRPGPSPKLTVAALALLVAGLGVVGTMRPRRPRRRAAAAGARASDVDLDRYLGLWHEFARYENWFERGAKAVTAEYSRRPDGLIRIVNAEPQGRPLRPVASSGGHGARRSRNPAMRN